MAFGILGLIVAISFVLLVIAYATSTRKDMSLAVSLGSAIFLFVISALFFLGGKTPLGLVLLVFGIYSMSRYVKVKKESAKPVDPEEKVSRSLVTGEMSEEEACFILEVREGASREDIQRAYKRMMMEFHPDRQGNSYMAAKINQARDTLLER
jgi:predicted membrane protein